MLFQSSTVWKYSLTELLTYVSALILVGISLRYWKWNTNLEKWPFLSCSPSAVWGGEFGRFDWRNTSVGWVCAAAGAALVFSAEAKRRQLDAKPCLLQRVASLERGGPGQQVPLWPQVHQQSSRKRKGVKDREGKFSKVSLSVHLFVFQEWSHSAGLLALQTGGEAKSTADTGAGTSHPEGSHL